MKGISVDIVSKKVKLPEYQTEGASGMDLAACIEQDIVIAPGELVIVPTGLRMAIETGYELQIRSRSGLALKYKVVVAQGIGTIDADYRGDIGVLIINHGSEDFVINDGMRIAQGVFAEVVKASFEVKKNLSDTVRGSGGFGHSGTH